MTVMNRRTDHETELLDAEVWDAPDRLSPDDCLIQTGPDWRWTGGETDLEDDQ